MKLAVNMASSIDTSASAANGISYVTEIMMLSNVAVIQEYWSSFTHRYSKKRHSIAHVHSEYDHQITGQIGQTPSDESAGFADTQHLQIASHLKADHWLRSAQDRLESP